MDRISSPEQLNKLMRVSRTRIWVILVLLLLLAGGGLYWFMNKEVVISEKYPCYVSEEEVPLGEYFYEILLKSSGDAGLAQDTLDRLTENLGKEHMKQMVHPAILYLADITKTEIGGMETVKVAGFAGSVTYVPDETFDLSSIVKDVRFTEKEMRQAGMNPGIDYYPVLINIKEDQNGNGPAPGLYTATVIIDVLKPSSMILR